MDTTKYIGMDVHRETISIAVMNSAGKLVMESIIETKAITILQFVQGLRGNLHVTFEEGTWAAWLYDLLKPYVTKVVVCNPRRNALLKTGNESDRIDARKLAELLRAGLLSAVYHGETGIRTLKELSRSYLTISKDLTRVMNRLKALYRSWAIPCAGTSVYAPRHRSEWLGKIMEAGVRRRAQLFYQQLDTLQALRQEVRRDLLAESRKHSATKLLRQIPCIGPIRAALLIALIQEPWVCPARFFARGTAHTAEIPHDATSLRSLASPPLTSRPTETRPVAGAPRTPDPRCSVWGVGSCA